MKKWQKTGAFVSAIAFAGVALAGCGTANNTATSNSGGATTGAGNTTTGSSKSVNKNITIGYVNWSEDVATTFLWKNLLTKKGYNVTVKELNAGPLFVGLSKQGGLDVFFDTWLPHTHKAYMDKYGKSLTSLGKWYQGKTKIGLVVPQYVYNKGITSISDLNKNASKFNNQIIGIGPGAGEMQTLKGPVKKAYNLKLNIVDGSSAAMISSLKKAENAHKDVVVTLWSPHWAFAKWKLKYLKDPKGKFGQPGWIQTEANKQWVKGHPTMTKYLKNFKLTPMQLGKLEESINKNGKTKGVQDWINNNKSLVDGWFK
ncbi:glycine betaine ABC transporter substrate-binding protein [Alicyclobacillus sp. SO9]|uniref:glycine betaine ABC transporter substrate-binding protein n=1 Tax=Alicyclobacillus sp. SO9 TaxID=2665646 RepID=UPI001938BBCA|nr:glycine betaine ABC transporter substrate-binding protein [Alicyclobacillus sp. SO9]QQE78601.1 glycine betaine ABC transporter substrate-binding protein [Alicyclobacillus sp. SO9]